MKRRWQIKPEGEVGPLVENLGIDPVTAQLLINRGINTPQAAAKFLNPKLEDLPSPYLLHDMKKAAERVSAAVQNSEKIAIYGDYDVDGITGTTLLTTFLKDVGATDIVTYIPNRIREGYGLNVSAVETLIKDGCKLIISVDTGTTAFEPAIRAKTLRSDLIITDHHRPHKELPDSFAMLSPYHPNSEYPDLDICGVGVAFNLAAAIRNELKQNGWFSSRPIPNLRKTLDLVAMGTVADVVPLTGVNRIFVSHGLPLISNSHRVGIKALLRSANVEGDISTYHIGFILGPRINASGRLEDASIGLRLLLTEDPNEASALANQLESINSERRYMQEQILGLAKKILEDDPENINKRATVVAGRGWHQGVVGIVASKLIDSYYRPTIVLSIQDDGSSKGSARSIPGIDLPTLLRECEDSLKEWGGHAMAAGLTVKPNSIDQFREKLFGIIALRYGDGVFEPQIDADCSLEPKDISAALLKEIDLLRPFGIGNPAPLFITQKVRVKNKKIVGRNHLKMEIQSGTSTHGAIAFQQGDQLEKISRDISLLYTPEINVWNGRSSLQLKVKEMQDSA